MGTYITTQAGGMRLAGKVNPSRYIDPSRPEKMPSEILRENHKACDIDLATKAAFMASYSRACGEGEARENKPWKVGQYEVHMPTIADLDSLLAWLLSEGLTARPSKEDSDSGLHSICYRLCMEDVRFLRVHQKERHHSVATEAAANAANLLWRACLSPESTVRVRGKYKGLTLLEATLESNGGKPFPIMRLVGWICALETQSELNRSVMEFDQEKAALLTRYIENMQEDSEAESDVNLWREYLVKAAAEEEARGKDTLRQDMLLLYRTMRLSRKTEGHMNSPTGLVARESVQSLLGWSKSKVARVKMELMISREYWTKSEKTARANEDYLRAQYRAGYIGDKAQQAANKAKAAA